MGRKSDAPIIVEDCCSVTSNLRLTTPKKRWNFKLCNTYLYVLELYVLEQDTKGGRERYIFRQNTNRTIGLLRKPRQTLAGQ